MRKASQPFVVALSNDTFAFGQALMLWRRLTEFTRLSAFTVVSYLVDPASSHMLVFKTKPCKSKYKQSIRRNCRWLIKTVLVYAMDKITWIPVVIPELIHARRLNARTAVFIRLNTNALRGFGES